MSMTIWRWKCSFSDVRSGTFIPGSVSLLPWALAVSILAAKSTTLMLRICVDCIDIT